MAKRSKNKPTKKKHDYFNSEEAQEHYAAWIDDGCVESQNALAVMIHEVVKRLVNKAFDSVSQNSDEFDELCSIVNAHIWSRLIDGKYDPSKGKLFAWVTSVIIRKIKDIWRSPKRNNVSIDSIVDTSLSPTTRNTTELVEVNEEFHSLILRIQGSFPMYLPQKCVMELLSELINHNYKLTRNLINAVQDILRNNSVFLRGMSRMDFTQFLLALVRNQAIEYAVELPNTPEGITLNRVLEHIIGTENAYKVLQAFVGMTLVIPDIVRRKNKATTTLPR